MSSVILEVASTDIDNRFKSISNDFGQYSYYFTNNPDSVIQFSKYGFLFGSHNDSITNYMVVSENSDQSNIGEDIYMKILTSETTKSFEFINQSSNIHVEFIGDSQNTGFDINTSNIESGYIVFENRYGYKIKLAYGFYTKNVTSNETIYNFSETFPVSVRNFEWTLMFSYYATPGTSLFYVTLFGDTNKFNFYDFNSTWNDVIITYNKTNLVINSETYSTQSFDTSDLIKFYTSSSKTNTNVKIKNITLFQGNMIGTETTSTSSIDNIFMGSAAGFLNTQGNGNIFIGNSTGYYQDSKMSDVAIGTNAYMGYPDDTLSLTYLKIGNGYNNATYRVENRINFKNESLLLDSYSIQVNNFKKVIIYIYITDKNLINDIKLYRNDVDVSNSIDLNTMTLTDAF